MAMTFFGQFLGSLIVGIMIKITLVRNIFIFAMVMNALSIVVIITFLQDSLEDKTKSVVVCEYTLKKLKYPKLFDITNNLWFGVWVEILMGT